MYIVLNVDAIQCANMVPKDPTKKKWCSGYESLCDLNESMKVRLTSNNPCWWLILFHNSRFLGSVFLQTIPIHRLSLVWPAWAVETIDRSQTPSCWTVGWNVSLSSKNDLEFDTCMCLDKVEELGQFVKLVCPVQIATSKQRNKAGWNLSISFQEVVTTSFREVKRAIMGSKLQHWLCMLLSLSLGKTARLPCSPDLQWTQ